jgi:hypothetical protein
MYFRKKNKDNFPIINLDKKKCTCIDFISKKKCKHIECPDMLAIEMSPDGKIMFCTVPCNDGYDVWRIYYENLKFL